MGRPPKLQRVDYFPHMCIHNGKTLFILEQRYREKGYTFWFKLLEKLGSTIGHALDLSDPAEWELLQARSFSNASVCEEIIDLLVRLEAIDKDLWTLRRIVWCQNFVDNLADVYRKRNCALPLKPVLSVAESTGKAGFPARKSEYPGVSGAESAARIGQDRIGQEREGSRGELCPEPDPSIPDRQGCLFENFWKTFRPTMPLRHGKFLDEDECRAYAAKRPALWGPWLAGVKNYAASEEAKAGAVMHPMKFLMKAYVNWQTPEAASSGQGPPPDLRLLRDLEADERVFREQQAKKDTG